MAQHPKTVGDMMTREVVTLREEQNLGQVMAGLERFGFRHLPVVDGDKLVGLVTQRDLLSASVSSLRGSAPRALDASLQENVFIATIMNRDIDTVTPDTPIVEAARRMRDHKFGCLPVVNGPDRKLVGIITESDFLDLAINLLEG
jgi:CBS domain-containing protein